MKKHKVRKIVSALMLSGVLATTVSTTAFADDSTLAIAPNANVVTPVNDSSSASTTNDENEKAVLYVVENGIVTPIEIDSKILTVGFVLKKHNINADDFRTSANEPIDSGKTFENVTEMFIFKNDFTVTTELVELPFPETIKETDTLFKGETKVETEGQKGKAIKTVVTVKSLSTDSDVNKALIKDSNDTGTTEETLTIAVAPVAKVTLVGTKERPAETTVETDVENDAASRSSWEREEIFSVTTEQETVQEPITQAQAPIATYSADDGARAVEIARAQLGKPYVWGAAGPNAFDCSGLIYYAYAINLGYSIPRVAYNQGLSATQISASDLKPGDILYSPDHIVMYAGNGIVIHAADESTGVIESYADWFLSNGYIPARIAM